MILKSETKNFATSRPLFNYLILTAGGRASPCGTAGVCAGRAKTAGN